MSNLTEPTLVVNKGFNPMHVKIVADAICDVFQGKACFVEHSRTLINGENNPYFYSTFTWEDWEKIEVISKQNDKNETEYFANMNTTGVGEPQWVVCDRIIHLPKKIIRAPYVVKYLDYDGMPDLDIRLTKKNLLLRDGFACQYCSKDVNLNSATIEHVIPRAAGGKNSWINCVIACRDCNTRKANRTPEQAKMPLKGWVVADRNGNMTHTYVAFKPRWYALFAKSNFVILPEWEDFLPEAAKNHPSIPPKKAKKHG